MYLTKQLRQIVRFVAMSSWFCLFCLGARADSELHQCRMVKDGVGEIVAFETITAKGIAAPISGLLVKPEASAPYPAVILLHRVFGVEKPECFGREIARYRSWGYATLLIDSDSAPPEVRTSTSGQTPTGYSFKDQAADSFGAVEFLSSLADIKGSKIFLIGHAYGGSAVLRAISKASMRARLSDRYGQFRASLSGAIAWHPSCPDRLQGVGVPLLMITGSKDSMNSSHACEVMAVDVLPNTVKPDHVVYSDAGHNFDMDWFTEYDPQTTELAYAKIASFLNRSR